MFYCLIFFHILICFSNTHIIYPKGCSEGKDGYCIKCYSGYGFIDGKCEECPEINLASI